MSLIGLAFCVSFIFKKFSRRCLILNAFSTTLVQNALSFLSACVGNALLTHRVFVPSTTNSMIVNAHFYFQTATFVHGLGSALNISLLWVEIAANKELRIFNNITRTKYLMLAALASVYLVWISLGLIFCNYCLVVIAVNAIVLFMVISFGIGSQLLSRMLQSRPQSDTDGCRKKAQDAEIQTMFSNTNGVIAFGILIICSQFLYLKTYELRNPRLSFYTFIVSCFSAVGIDFTVLWHLKGKSLFPMNFRFNQKKKYRIKVAPEPERAQDFIQDQSLQCESKKSGVGTA